MVINDMMFQAFMSIFHGMSGKNVDKLELCSSASRKDWRTGCSRFRTSPPVWLLVLDVQTT